MITLGLQLATFNNLSLYFVLSSVVLVFVFLVVGLRSSISFNPDPAFADIPESSSLSPALEKAITKYEDGLKSLKYTRVGIIASDDIISNGTFVGVLYENTPEATAVMITVNESRAKKPDGSEIVIENAYVEFWTEFADESSVMTNDSKDVPFGARVSSRATYCLKNAELRTLHRVHSFVLSTRGKRLQRVGNGWSLAEAKGAVQKFHSRNVKHGYLRPCSDGKYRMTWKGAVIGLITNIPPFKGIWRWWYTKEAREIETLSQATMPSTHRA